MGKFNVVQRLFLRIIKDNPDLLAIFLSAKQIGLNDYNAIDLTISTIIPMNYRSSFLNTIFRHPLSDKYIGKELTIKLFGSTKDATTNVICKDIISNTGYFVISDSNRYWGVSPDRITKVDGETFYPKLYTRMFQTYMSGKSHDEIYEDCRLITNDLSIKNLSRIAPHLVYNTPFVENKIWRILCSHNKNLKSMKVNSL